MPRIPRIQARSEGGRNTYYTINFEGKRHYLGADFAVAHERAAQILGRIAARGVDSFESSGAIGYDCGIKSDNWAW